MDGLIELRLVERLSRLPTTHAGRDGIYRIADNFPAFWLGVVDRYQSEIERGLGSSIAPAIINDLDRHAGAYWHAAVRDHLRRLARQDRLGEQVVAVGPWWRDAPEPVEVDALVLATERRLPVLAAEATWATTADGARVARVLERKLQRGPGADTQVRLAVAAREEVTNASGLLAITADDGFA